MSDLSDIQLPPAEIASLKDSNVPLRRVSPSKLSPAEQDKIKRDAARSALNALNCPTEMVTQQRIDQITPFLTVLDCDEIDPDGPRKREDGSDLWPTEWQRHVVSRAFVVDKDGNERTVPCSLGSGVNKPYPVERMVRELADTNRTLRWVAWGKQH